MQKHKSRLLLVVALGIVLFQVLLPVRSRAADIAQQVFSGSGCGQEGVPSYQALVGAKKDAYTAYVRLGRTTQTAPATLYFQSLQTGVCERIGTVNASGDAWQPLGVWNVVSPTDAGNFILQSGAIDSAPTANRPTVMLVSQSQPVCQPTTECYVNIGSDQGVVRPVGTLLNEDTLHVVTAVDPATDSLQKVTYYVDDRSVYTTKSLENFNLSYVGLGSHILTRVATYKSGQSVVFSSTFDNGYDHPMALLISIMYGQNTLLKITLLIILIAAVWWLFRAVIRAIHKRRVWKATHFVKQEKANSKPKNVASSSSPHFTKPDSALKTAAQWVSIILAILAVAALSIALVYNFVAQIYQVDGPSMQTTLFTGQHLLVNRLGQTWAKLDRKKYVPKRGNIIVFKKGHSTLLSLDTPQEEGYVVKRVIALPGERVTVNNGVITVYNAQSKQGFNPDAGHAWTANIQPTPPEEVIDITLGPDEIFVSGDNRPESVDSRSYGAVKVDNIIGQVVLRLPPGFKTF